MTLPAICRPWHPMYKWGSRLLCVTVFLLQCVTLDYYLVTFLSPMWAAWVIADVICLGLFLMALFLASNRAHARRVAAKCDKSRFIGNGELPFCYVAWAVYSVQFAARTFVLFRYVASQLEEKDYFGPNTMRTAMALTAVLFLELVLAHQDAPRKKCIHDYVNDVASSTALDILDALAILDVLYDPKSRDNLDIRMHTAIVAISSINVFLPVIPMFVLSRGHFEEKRSNVAVYMSYRLLHALLGDVALLTMRMFLWHFKEEKISVFTIKNCISIGMTLKRVYEIFVPEEQRSDDGDGSEIKVAKVKPRKGPKVKNGTGAGSSGAEHENKAMRPDDPDGHDLGLDLERGEGGGGGDIELTLWGGDRPGAMDDAKVKDGDTENDSGGVKYRMSTLRLDPAHP